MRSSWIKLSVIIPALLVIMSLASLISQALNAEDFSNFFSFFLSRYTINSLIICISVSLSSLIIGATLAALVSFYHFPGSRLLEWLFILPLAFPAYVMAYAYISLFDFSGPIQTLIRSTFEQSISFPPIRSTSGLIMVLSFCLYPYVYLLARNSFQTMGKNIFEAARSLGFKPIQTFFKITLPNSWPWLIAGVSVVGMETLADFGAVSVFNYESLTLAIYRSWLGHFSLANASLICLNLLSLILVFSILFKFISPKSQIDQSGMRSKTIGKIHTTGLKKWLLCFCCWLFFCFSFLIPLMQILYWSYLAIELELWQKLSHILYHSAILGLTACLILTTLAFLANMTQRFYPSAFLKKISNISQLGYALPGTILAIAVFIPFIKLDHWIADSGLNWFNIDLPLIFTGSIFTLIIGYLIRFYVLPYRTIDAAQKRLPTEIDQAAASLGHRQNSILARIHFPALKGGLLTAMILVFVDVLKEMPLTLMMRPFGWDTLSVRIYEMTSEGDWAQASIPALVLILLGMFPVRFLIKKTNI